MENNHITQQNWQNLRTIRYTTPRERELLDSFIESGKISYEEIDHYFLHNAGTDDNEDPQYEEFLERMNRKWNRLQAESKALKELKPRQAEDRDIIKADLGDIFVEPVLEEEEEEHKELSEEEDTEATLSDRIRLLWEWNPRNKSYHLSPRWLGVSAEQDEAGWYCKKLGEKISEYYNTDTELLLATRTLNPLQQKDIPKSTGSYCEVTGEDGESYLEEIIKNISCIDVAEGEWRRAEWKEVQNSRSTIPNELKFCLLYQKFTPEITTGLFKKLEKEWKKIPLQERPDWVKHLKESVIKSVFLKRELAQVDDEIRKETILEIAKDLRIDFPLPDNISRN